MSPQSTQTQPWETILDELYRLGGYAEFESDATEHPLDLIDDLEQLTDFSTESIRKAAGLLDCAELADYGQTVEGPADAPNNERDRLFLSPTGFETAHHRQVEHQRRDHEEEMRETQIEVERDLNRTTRLLSYFTAFLVGVGGIQALDILPILSGGSFVIVTVILSLAIGLGFGLPLGDVIGGRFNFVAKRNRAE